MQLGQLQHARVLSAAVLCIRHLLLPLLAWALARLLGLDATQTAVLLAFSALPTASSCYVLAARMGYNGAYVGGPGHAVHPAGAGKPAAGAGRAALMLLF